jgi:hypothetical protein
MVIVSLGGIGISVGAMHIVTLAAADRLLKQTLNDRLTRIDFVDLPTPQVAIRSQPLLDLVLLSSN